ncbi:MAG TPA: SRPBCC family protein [Ramlibacter sp.]|uniref:SRPBCC family protein n=1 Tax=Ramlibacter sp. TaxID=1917967 RepID=UPI002D394A1E|nr:SRPBCC family protein [Ramlibacter sp.]HZY20041.1 SRPBCC family protein [Ramlibacter sp.]
MIRTATTTEGRTTRKPRKAAIFLAGAAYGLAMRLAFGMLPFFAAAKPTAASGPMLASFVLLVPLGLGAWTVLAARDPSPDWGWSLTAPWIPTLCFVAGTALLLLEGSICIALALPIFLAMATLGGLVGRVSLRFVRLPRHAAHALLLLPLLAGTAETHLPVTQQLAESRASTVIAAPPEAIWSLINRATDIRPQEMAQGIAFRIGVPSPMEAVTQDTPQGRLRRLRWARGVSFDEPIEAWEENRFIRWRYAFAPDSFPPGALDDHVVIGGRYFDLVDTSYALTPVPGGTRLDIVVHYRVGTNFNWYAGWWGRLLVDDAAATILQFYKARAEAAGVRPAPSA